MEATDCVYGGYYSAGTPQMGQEKKAGGGDHFIVEELLDFSNEEEDSGANNRDDAAFEAAEGNSSANSSTITAVESCKSSGGDQQFSGEKITCRSVAADATGDLCEPSDDLAELEWLSNFVEESFSSEDHQKLQLISGVKAGSGQIGSSSETGGGDGKFTTIQHQHPAPFYLPEASTVPGKARSKRSRAAPCNWSSRLLVLSPTAATSSSDSDPVLLNPKLVRKSPKPAKKREAGPAAGLMAAPDGRKCLHCATDKTPQWRTGPMGAKTLCNACGVRYKSGRLVPEYRPAASPTFVLSQHSNSHRKVLELRRQKELQQHQTPPPPPPPFLHAGAPIFDADTMGPVAGADDFLIHHHLGADFRQLI